jgi:hypothetical protein
LPNSHSLAKTTDSLQIRQHISSRSEASFLKRPFARLPRLFLSEPPPQGRSSRSALRQLRPTNSCAAFRTVTGVVSRRTHRLRSGAITEASRTIRQFLAPSLPVRPVSEPLGSTHQRGSLPVACHDGLARFPFAPLRPMILLTTAGSSFPVRFFPSGLLVSFSTVDRIVPAALFSALPPQTSATKRPRDDGLRHPQPPHLAGGSALEKHTCRFNL